MNVIHWTPFFKGKKVLHFWPSTCAPIGTHKFNTIGTPYTHTYFATSYNLDIGECIWYILTNLTNKGHLKQTQLSDALIRTYQTLKF